MPQGKYSYRKKRKSTTGLAKLKKDVSKIKSFVNKTLENKTSVYSTTSMAVGDAWAYNYDFMLRMAQGVQGGPLLNEAGTAEPARIGDSVTVTEIRFDILVTRADSSNALRLICGYAENNQSSLIASDILCMSRTGANVKESLISPYKRGISADKKYTLLFDKLVFLANSGNQRKFTVIKKYPRGKVIQYVPETNVPANFNITLMAISDSAAAAHPTISYITRVTYKDA